MVGNSLLLWLTFFPMAGALVAFLAPERTAKYIALATALGGTLFGAVLYVKFDAASSAQFQYVYSASWIKSLGVNFAFGVDGLSFALVLLTKLMMPIAVLASWNETRRSRAMMISFLVLDTAMTGTFLTTDMFLFYVFWELMLLPMLLLIGVWGSADRIYASLKFFLYTFAGSMLMLAAIFWVFIAHDTQNGFYTGNIASFYGLSFPGYPVFLGLTVQQLVFLGFAFAFLVKVPLFPLHTWLPDAHVQAPTGGSILLAAVLLKMGTYGLLRFAIPICPNGFSSFAPLLAILSIIGILYGAWVAFQQTDIKKLVAYSSVSHLGFVVLGICAMNTIGLTGAVLQMVNHGLTTGALFLMIGMLYERRHTRKFSDYGGLASVVPWFSFFLVFVSCASMAVPGLNGFVGEFLILLGAFQTNPYWVCIAVLGVIFGAAYTLLMLRQILFGEVTHEENKTLKDLVPREWAALLPLCFFMIVLGISPKPFIEKIRPSLEGYWNSIKATAVAQQQAEEPSEAARVIPRVQSHVWNLSEKAGNL